MNFYPCFPHFLQGGGKTFVVITQPNNKAFRLWL